LLEYFNYSMLLNKYELKKLHQQHNAYFLNISNSRSATAHATSALVTTPTAPNVIKLNRVPSNLSAHPSHTVPYRLNATGAAMSHRHNQHQLSSGYNSENHSNSSNSTSTTTIHNLNQNHFLNQQNMLNFYRLSLNHLPLNFTNTQCTCAGRSSGLGVTANGKKHNDLSKSLSNNNISFKNTKCAPLSSSPNSNVHCDDEDDPFLDEDDDLDDDLDDEDDEEDDEEEEENEDENEEAIEEEGSAVELETSSNKAAAERADDPIKISNHSLNKLGKETAATNTASSQSDKFYFNTVQRAHGTSSCPHTAKVDIRRVRSFTDLTQKQIIYNEDDFEFKEKLGEGFFANVKKCVSKRTGREMVLKELKLNCVNLKKREEEDGSVGDANSLDSLEQQQQPRIDLMINYAELNAAHKSFLKEAQVLRNLNHPNVIKLMGVMFAKERQFNLILEYIGGGTLKGNAFQ
jgi:hypothetical protein